MGRPRILLIQACDDGKAEVQLLRSALSTCSLWQADDLKLGPRSRPGPDFDLECFAAIVLVIDLASAPQSFSLLQDLRNIETPILAAAIGGDPADRLRLIEEGADDFIDAPFPEGELFPRIRLLLRRPRHREPLLERLKTRLGLRQLVGESPAFIEQIKLIPPAADCAANVMIAGETGTGKELVARAVHYLSRRRKHPFVPVACGAVPAELAESELFGHKQGAYTGAVDHRSGLIREAQGGTLFLDDVDCLPASVQVKLLRFLQEKEYRQLGSDRLERADVRVISACNCDLMKMIGEGRFRADLFYRLNVIPLAMPPLRERAEDVILLAQHFVTKFASQLGRRVRGVSDDAVQVLMLYEWPGNIRELENVIERAVVYCEHAVLRAADLNLPSQSDRIFESFGQAKARVVAKFERDYIRKALRASHGNITDAARRARKNRRVFWELIRKHGIDVHQFKPNSSAK